MSTLTNQQRLDRAAEQARTESATVTQHAVEKAVRHEQRRIDREASRERQAEQIAHYRTECAIENGIEHLPRTVTDQVWALTWQEGHSSGFGEVANYYGEYAPLVLAAYEAGLKDGRA